MKKKEAFVGFKDEKTMTNRTVKEILLTKE
jgi:hypothetical protein